ncbi:tail fiber domain-containing protein [Pedobacter sp. PLR]|uniref:tail fiber domain-containing protein n=1 Tax=Pedobacter sp. PLR TaxID=2994465 RepID=UPI0022486697|nr:tail fiber domain-containing protein [Pedobacter sp. PLR]MCX2452992.1 tail fiber domain-containing protein [Pedobacter sp. PLR]
MKSFENVIKHIEMGMDRFVAVRKSTETTMKSFEMAAKNKDTSTKRIEVSTKNFENYIPMKAIYTFCVFLCMASFSAVGQVKVIGALEPNDLTDKYSTHSDIYGKGGFRSVANNSERDEITPARRSVGMLVYSIQEEKFYQLKAGITNSNWVESQMGGGTGGGGTGILALEKGGTGAATAEEARVNLGLGTLAIQNKDAVEITNGAIDGTLIGNSTPAQGKFTTLDVNSELTVTGQVIVNGDIKASGDVTANSDIRLKKNIVTLPPVSEQLRRLHAVSYDRRDVDLHQIGFIAQNVQEFFPSLVKADGDQKKTLSLNYQSMTVPLLKGWQEHDEEIAVQQRELKTLKSEVEELKKAVAELKELLKAKK